MKNSLLSFILVAFLAMPVAFVAAQEPQPCDSCAGYNPGSYMRSGGPELGGDTFRLSCQSGVWEDLDADACSACTPDPCQCGSPSPGDTCSDGTIYAGNSPDGDVPMYTMAADAGQFSWNDGTSNWLDTVMVNCVDGTPGTATSCRSGRANTDYLVGLSGTGSPAPYEAAEYCSALAPPDAAALGHDDWYLPAQDELDVLYDNLVDQDGDNIPGGPLGGTFGFNISDDYPAGYYLSSSEYSYVNARGQGFRDGDQNVNVKLNALAVRCVRR